MPIYEIDGIGPDVDDEEQFWLAPDAAVIGRVKIGVGVGIWFGAVLRGDNEAITLGDGTNVQEHVVMHTDPGFPLSIGRNCTIGHRAILHGCTIGNNTLVGMGAIILNGARIGDNCLIGAGALVTEGKSFPDGSLIVGTPARAVRELDEGARAGLAASASHYVANARRFRKGLRQIR